MSEALFLDLVRDMVQELKTKRQQLRDIRALLPRISQPNDPVEAVREALADAKKT